MTLRYMQKKAIGETLQILVKIYIISLHYNGDDSYLFVNGRQELKFKAKTDQLVKEKLCIGMDNGPMDSKRIRKNRVTWKYLSFCSGL